MCTESQPLPVQSLCFPAGQTGSFRGGQCLHTCDQLVGKKPLLSFGRNSVDKGRARHGESQPLALCPFSLSLCVWETPRHDQGGWLPGCRVSSQTTRLRSGQVRVTSHLPQFTVIEEVFFFMTIMISFLLLMVHPFPTPGQDLPWVQ